MAHLSGLFTSIFISLTSIPLVIFVTNRDVLSEPFLMMFIGFALLAAVTLLAKILIPPSNVPQKGNLEGRGFLYYTCCLFMWACIADLTIQSRHLNFFGFNSNTRYFETGEAYLATPFGCTTQLWNAIFHYFLQLIIIYQIDNNIDCRTSTLYWCGSIMTSQFVVLFGGLSGSYSDKLEYSVWMNVIFIALPVWFFCKFIFKPISPSKIAVAPKYSAFDIILIMFLLLMSTFSVVRGLGGLGSKVPLIKHYVDNFEPYIKDPSNFGSMWVLYTALYGAPFQLMAIYGLMKPGCTWMLNLSVYFASGMLQGTFTYMSYQYYSHSELQYHVPHKVYPLVLTLNVLLVVVAHTLMARCISRPAYFTFSKQNVKISKD